MATIEDYIKQYLLWREVNKEYELTEREGRIKWYNEKMGSSEKIKNLAEKDFHELIDRLWALRFLYKKEFKIDGLLCDNGLDKIKTALAELLYSKEPITEKWDNFRRTIKGFGPAFLSEILTFTFPNQYGIINKKIISVLSLLGFLTEEETKVISYGYGSGDNYAKFMQVLKKVLVELKNNGLPEADFIDVDFFILYLSKRFFIL